MLIYKQIRDPPRIFRFGTYVVVFLSYVSYETDHSIFPFTLGLPFP